MTTQTTTIQPSRQGVRALIGATAFTLVVLGGAALWQLRRSNEATAPSATSVTTTTADATLPMGGLAERYRDQARAAAAEREARVTTMGGIAELYAEQQAEAQATIEREGRRGGMAELYREQELARRTAAP